MIDEIASTFSNGRVVILPTDTIYGLHARADDEQGIARIGQLKKRTVARSIVVLAADVDQCIAVGALIEPALREQLERVWPAPLTAILPTSTPLAANPGERTIAIRIPALEWLRELLRRTGPLASSSLNESGEPPMHDLAALSFGFLNGVDGIVEAGPLDGKPSTLVDFTGPEPRLIRGGAFPFAQNLWKRSRKTL